MKVAIVQHKCSEADLEKNTKIGISYVEEAKKNGADLVLFPEGWITSYSFPAITSTLLPVEEIENDAEFKAWSDRVITKDSVFLRQFCEKANELSIGIVITGFTKGKVYPRNTAFIIDRDGTIILKYNKVHTCDFSSERYLESGDEFYVCEFDGIQIGCMICYDREYPESARELMLQGAEIIVVPNDCSSMEPRLQELSVRAMENMVGVVMANPPGDDAGHSCAYYPMIWDRDGKVLENKIVIADEHTEGIIYATFDIEAIREYRKREDIGKYRKVRTYKNLTIDK